MGIGFNAVGNFSKISSSFADKSVVNAVNITIMGVGGAGGNIIKFLMDKNISGVNFVYANTDLQALSANPVSNVIQLGKKTTAGFGAGSDPNVGEASAIEATEEIKASLNGTNMLILIAGLGGGTGTGASPVIAKIAKEMGILVLSFAVLPFDFEGERKNIAETWIKNLLVSSDSLISLSNQKLLNLDDSNLRFDLSLEVVHDIVFQGVNSIVSLLNQNELINRDFSDIVHVMKDKGLSLISSGKASFKDEPSRAIVATEKALNNPLLSDVSIYGAKGIIVTICAKQDSLKTIEVSEVMNRISKEMNSYNTKANILLGVSFNDAFNDELMVSIIATGLSGKKLEASNPVFSEAFDNYNRSVGSFGQTASFNSTSVNQESSASSDLKQSFESVESIDNANLNTNDIYDEIVEDKSVSNITDLDDASFNKTNDKIDFDFHSMDSDFGFSSMTDKFDNDDIHFDDDNYSLAENKKGFFQSFFGRNDKLRKSNKDDIYTSSSNNDKSDYQNNQISDNLDFLKNLKDINSVDNAKSNDNIDMKNNESESNDEIKISFLNSSMNDDEFFSDINIDPSFSDDEKEIIKNDVVRNESLTDDNVTYISEMDNKKEAPKYYSKQVDIFELIESITGTK